MDGNDENQNIYLQRSEINGFSTTILFFTKYFLIYKFGLWADIFIEFIKRSH